MKINLKKKTTAEKTLHYFIQSFSKKHQIPSSVSADLDLALGELINNIIKYGYKKEEFFISVELKKESNQNNDSQQKTKQKIKGVLLDKAAPFNPLSYTSKNQTAMSLKEHPIGGSGLIIAKNILSLSYQRKNNTNQLKFYMVY